MSEEETKSPTESGSEEKPNSAKWVKASSGVNEIYADYFHVNWMPVSVRIRLGQVIADPAPRPDKATWAVEERAALTMPWATLKAITEMFVTLVQAYEKDNGTIIVPKIPELP
jgi:hypothetical protein